MIEYRIVDNPEPDEYPDSQCVETWQDGRLVARSFADEAVPVEARLNLVHPEADDVRTGAPRGQVVRWRPPDAEVAAVMGVDRDDLLAAASALGLAVDSSVGLRHGVEPGAPSPRTAR